MSQNEMTAAIIKTKLELITMSFFRFIVFLTFVFSLTACNGFFEKDNTASPHPLVSFKPEVAPYQVWSIRAGSGSGHEHLDMPPAIDGDVLYTSSTNGIVTAVNRLTGQKLWQVYTRMPIVTGPAARDGMLVFAARRGQIIALSQTDGAIRWQQSVSGAILAPPAIGQGLVVVKTINGLVNAFSANTGQYLWGYNQTEPNLILRGASSPLIRSTGIYAGFANGKLAKLSLQGRLKWLKRIATPEGAFSIQRMIDIDAKPLLYKQHLFAAAYQGRIAALSPKSGNILWSRDISSYTGMAADDDTVYISDEDSYLWAFQADHGSLTWRQDQLYARNITGPAMLGHYVIVGDESGYLHWINKLNGRFSARTQLRAPINSAPIVKDGVLYAYTQNGYLYAYVLK